MGPRNVSRLCVSLVQSVISDGAVQLMLRNMLEEEGLGEAFKEAVFEPRVTRSKAKERMQQVGPQQVRDPPAVAQV